MAELPIIQPGEVEAGLARELERFSFGIAVSPLAEVTPLEGPDGYVKTIAKLGGISIEHAQHPEAMEQRVIATGKAVPETVAGYHFIFDTRASLLMAWLEGNAGPIPVPPHVTSDLSDTIKTLNDNFEQQT